MPKNSRATRKQSKIIFAIALIVLASVAGLLFYLQTHKTIPDYAPPVSSLQTMPTAEEKSVTIVAAGDIACSTKSSNYNNGKGNLIGCHMKDTADLVKSLSPAAVLLLGDNQYENGELEQYQTSYAASWGVPEIKGITKPVPGNHEYNTKNAAGYYAYFGDAAGDPTKGYYSYDIGGWHMVALNSNCKYVACSEGSAQQMWLKADLAAHPAKCTLAYWHHPLFSSGSHGNDASTKPLYDTLANQQADVVLAGHDHLYERFSAQNGDGKPDNAGITSFVVGTGGKDRYPFRELAANSQVRLSAFFGVLKLELKKDSYSWAFVAEDGSTHDAGTSSCN